MPEPDDDAVAVRARQLVEVGAHACKDLLCRPGACHVDPGQRVGPLREVDVVIPQPGDRPAPLTVVDILVRRVSGERRCQADDPPALHPDVDSAVRGRDPAHRDDLDVAQEDLRVEREAGVRGHVSLAFRHVG